MDFTECTEPFGLFNDWLKEASETELNDYNAVALATVDPQGMPNVRMVLLKGHDQRGFVFYTNFESVKGQEALASMKAAMGFHWKSLRRQVRIRGELERVSEAEADAYYNSRHPQSRLGAWASDQSAPAGKAVKSWWPNSDRQKRNMERKTFPARHTGPDFELFHNPLNSGRTVNSDCTTALCSPKAVARTTGASSASTPRRYEAAVGN